MQEILNLVGGSIIPPLAVALAAWVVREVVELMQELQAKAAAHTSAATAATLSAGLATAQGVVCTIVQGLENTYVEKMKTSGKWGDPGVQQAAFASALTDAKAHVLVVAPQLASQLGSGLGGLLTSMIEAEVAKLSNPKAPAAAPAEVKL